MRRRVLSAFLLLCLLAELGGCAAVNLIQPIDELMRPPYENEEQEQLEQKLAELQSAEKTKGGKMIFRHPLGGQYRNAVTMQDIDGDGQEEAVVFYSSYEGARPENPGVHLAVFVKRGGVWEPRIAQGDGVTVASLSFLRLGGRGRGILVCWQKENADQCFTLYTLDAQWKLEKLLVQNYAVLTACDMTDDGTDEVVFIRAADAAKGTPSKAILLNYDTKKAQVYLLESQALDASLYAFAGLEPQKLEGGGHAILLDACRLAGSTSEPAMVTRLIEQEPAVGKTGAGSLRIALTDAASSRSLPLRARDFDGDGKLEIPSEYTLPGSSLADTENGTVRPITLISWNRPVREADGWRLEPVAAGNLYLTANRWVQLPPALAETVTIRGSDDGGIRSLRFFRQREDGSAGDELFSLRVVLLTGELRDSVLTERGRAEGIQLEFLQEMRMDEGISTFPVPPLPPQGETVVT